MRKLLLLAAALVLLVTAASAQSVKEMHRYAIKGADTLFVDRHVDWSRVQGDKIPTMIYMYGGGWAYGDRGGRFNYLTDIGVQVISIDYRKGLTKYGYNPAPPAEMEAAIAMALDDLTDAMAFVLKHAEDWKVDTEKVMLSGSSAGGITTLMAIYDICNGGPYSKKFPAGWMPAGYIGYAGAVINREAELSWAKKPCPMMFFHGSGDSTVTFNVIHGKGDALSIFGPTYILAQLHEMEVPNWLYCEIDGDHVLSYKPFSGYNTHEIQTFVEKFVVRGLQLEMRTDENNLVESSHLPGFRPVHSKNPDVQGIPNPTPTRDSRGFVAITDVVPEAILEIRYYSTYNFVGERIDGYRAPTAWLTREAADSLKAVSDDLMKQGYRLKIFDAYRPQEAVDHFVRWAANVSDTTMRRYFYPDVDKSLLFEQEYIMEKSGHTRGSTVDLTLFDMTLEKDVDMGATFDWFGEESHPDFCGNPDTGEYDAVRAAREPRGITAEQFANRLILRRAMLRHGFKPLDSEWWHFTLKNEPYPDTYFNFPIQ